MKPRKILAIALALSVFSPVIAQQDESKANITVDVDDEIYSILLTAQTKGYCKALSNMKPYTERYILSVLDEISDSLEKLDAESYSVKTEKAIVEKQKTRFIHKIEGLNLKNLEFSAESPYEKFPATFFIRDSIKGFVSGGLYDEKDNSSAGFDTLDYLDLYGNITSFLSYRAGIRFGFSYMPLTQLGDDYYIGEWWDDSNHFAEDDDHTNDRTINTFRNYATLPYTYKKPWSGSIYYLTNMTASGLEGWPIEVSGVLGVDGELHASFFDNKLEIGLGRYNHEVASMDTNSSLALNAMAQPFFGFDLHVKFFDWLSYDTITGWTEFPNQEYINGNAWYYKGDDNKNHTNRARIDSYYFQNMYTIKALNLDFPYFHMDIGSSCVYTKRFELGYMFPLIDSLLYQNSLGDYDNLGLFADIKGIWPGVGYVWATGFLDEMNMLKTKFWEKTRCMFAYQAGIKAYVPGVPFGNVSFRYTKIEPFCYTHTALKYQPYYDYYMSTSYTNNGYSLGYYMPPNSDEFLLDFNCRPTEDSYAGISYQLTRHGTDWGSGAVEGSNLYSELAHNGRDEKRKYFLYDGTYEWTSTVNLYGSYNFRSLNVPLKLNASIGYMFDWFTGVDNNGKKNDKFYKINTNEYSPCNGFMMSLGFTLFGN